MFRKQKEDLGGLSSIFDGYLQDQFNWPHLHLKMLTYAGSFFKSLHLSPKGNSRPKFFLF